MMMIGLLVISSKTTRVAKHTHVSTNAYIFPHGKKTLRTFISSKLKREFFVEKKKQVFIFDKSHVQCYLHSSIKLSIRAIYLFLLYH